MKRLKLLWNIWLDLCAVIAASTGNILTARILGGVVFANYYFHWKNL